ncbi:MAG: HlyC/CorC family transporter [Pseudonocardiales bacterium]|nr:HlyC/CorC family transporter [Pseudonocardiales bacterium]MBV9651233.1 HlyC/CorC family transporter [Pseudonocardiales bacterium]
MDVLRIVWSQVLVPFWGLFALVALTAGTFVFVAAEFALTTVERSTVDAHVQRVGDRRARQVQHARNTLSFQLSGAQVGITITTLLTGYVAQPAIIELVRPGVQALGLSASTVGAISLGVGLALATMMSMVFGELIPQNLAISRPLQTARQVAGVVNAFSVGFGWLISALNGTANWIVRRLGIEPAVDLRSARSPQELGSLVRSSAQHGTLDQGTATLLDRSLRFGERTAEELMTPRVRVKALRADAPVLALVDTARQTGFSRFPVYGGDLDDVRGVVHVKQAFALPAAQRAVIKVGSLASPVPTVPSSLDGDVLLERLRGQGLQVAIVVDEYGGTAGIVTLEDLVEEIVGDVRDEHDRLEVSRVRALDERSWLISGLLRADELADAVGFVMPEGDYETVAGLVLERLGRIPAVGDEIELDGWQLSVTRMDRRRIAELRLRRTAHAEQVTL